MITFLVVSNVDIHMFISTSTPSFVGNTCFLSSVLQVLRYTPDFVDNIGRLAADVKLCSLDDTDDVGLRRDCLLSLKFKLCFKVLLAPHS